MWGRGLFLLAFVAWTGAGAASPALLPVPESLSPATGEEFSAGSGASTQAVARSARPKMRDDRLPRARWGETARGKVWTRAAVAALRGHASGLVDTVPRDIEAWCPAYAQNDDRLREAFWVGLVSSLSRHESTWRPRVVGGGGRWHGLLQILPATARSYGCRAGSGDALLDGSANLACGLRIMARTVGRDRVVSAGMRGVAADWGPFHSSKKRADMMAWSNAQAYCQPAPSTRPAMRPGSVVVAAAPQSQSSVPVISSLGRTDMP